MSESRNVRAGCDDWLCSALLPLLDRVAVASDILQTANRKVLRGKKGLVANTRASNEHFQDIARDLIAKIREHTTSNIAAVRVLCHDRAKLLDTQVDELLVSKGQITACVTGGKAAMAQGHVVSVWNSFLAVTRVKKLCNVDLVPCVSAKLDIAADVISAIRVLENMAVLRLYDVDMSKSVVSGAGLVSCVRGMGAVNEVKLACVNSAGTPTDWVTVEDADVFVTGGNGVLIGRSLSGQVIEPGVIMIKYEVDVVDVEEVELSVTVGGVVVGGGPLRVAVCSFIKADAMHNKTITIKGTGNHGVAVTLDGLHLVVSNYGSHSMSVYCIDNGGCISTFGSEGQGAGQFFLPFRICATPRGTILVWEHGNKRLQEVTITGEHVRFLGDDHVHGGVFGLCITGDMIAVGKISGTSDGRITLFSYSSGALIRKFGSCGYSVERVTDVVGLSFTPDGRHVLVADYTPRLLMFTVDGAFVKTIGHGMLGVGGKDVLFSGSNIFVVDSLRCCIYVFSSETGAFIRKWDTKGQADGQCLYPIALAAHKSKLFVLDASSPRVQVFE